MSRVYVYSDFAEEYGKVVAICSPFEVFTEKISNLFQISHNDLHLYAANGCEIHDVCVIRDEEKIYLSMSPKKEGTKCENCKKEVPHLKNNDEKLKLHSDWITLNVGGKNFTTSRSTLIAKEPQCMLARMFSDDNTCMMNPSVTDDSGAYLIDRSPEYFEPLLNYLRHGQVILNKNVNPRGVLEEAIFYGIDSMIPQLQNLVDQKGDTMATDNRPLTRMDIVKSLIVTSTNTELRFQGVNLSGADLSRLDLRCINFKYACLSKCNLSGANLSDCSLERADLSHANLEGAFLRGIKALCANMEGANLKNCNMDDPTGVRATMEGVNLKGANMEGSNMTGVNLRVATLKNANLKNCDLRSAVLAGADLECCDLSGSDLHEANLRGANLKDTAFELMLTPLHMSQTIR